MPIRFDVGVTEELLSPIYMSLENEVNWVDQFPYYVETGEITSSDGYSYDWEFNINKGFNYCYKVVPFESPPIDGEDTECVDTQDYEDQWGGKCVEYESNAAWCGGYGAMGESGLTPNENCCVCKSKLTSSVAAVVVTPSPIIPTIPEAVDEVEGFSYGYGWCKDCNDVVHSKVIKNYVYSSDECALFCEPFKAESSYRGYTWTDGPGNEDHCYCMVDSDSDLSSLSSKYGGDRIEQNAGSGPIGYSNLALGKTYDAYCYAETRDTCPSATTPTTSPPTAVTVSSPCFDADDGGNIGILYNAVRAYVSQDCASNQECPIAQIYGWPMNSWCVGNVKDMSFIFIGMDTFNEGINGWNTSSVTDMSYMFNYASSFNGDVSNFDTSSVTRMDGMFWDASSFNRDVSNFDTSSVTTMSNMFYRATSFNGDLSSFNTSSVTTMNSMFYDATAFNKDLSNFDTSSVTSMGGMFREATSFNGDVSNFDTSSITNMGMMFYGATSFSQDLCAWRDSFPYTALTWDIFTDSNCTYQDTPQDVQKGPFCASDCQSSSVTPVPVGVPLSATSPPTAAAATDETAIQDTLENSEANTIEIKLKPYADLDWRNMILFEPYVPSPIVSASCSNKCPCSFTPYDEDDCQCGIEMVCGGTIPIDLASGNELKFVWEASSDNDKYISVTGTSQTRVEFRLTIQDCTAPYQLIHGSNVTIVIDGLDGTEQKFTHDLESSFVILGSKYGDICDVYTRMQFNPNENGVLDMKFTTLTFTAGYDNTKVTDETSYTWATDSYDSYTWIRQPEGGSIKMLDNMSPIPTTANDGIDDQFCLEETKALEECGIYDIDNLDMAEACAMCQVEAMGDDVMSFNTDSFCNKWKACANEKCPAACITPMNDLQVCMFQDTGMTVDCLSSPDNANADNVVNEVESKAQRRQVITAVMIMGICGVIFA